MAGQRQLLGTLGEQEACRRLEEQGYTILARNYRVRGGELDIVCEQAGVVVFCEVKTRTSALFGTPEESVTAIKQQRIRRLAVEYLRKEHRRARKMRFDVFSITVQAGKVTTVRHIVGAF